jgi:hypothetical protein
MTYWVPAGPRSTGTGTVHPIGDQYDDLAAGRRVAKSVHRRRESHAEGRAVLVARREIDLVEGLLQHQVVQRERGTGRGQTGEDHQTQAVGATPVDEPPHGLLGHLEAIVGLEVLGAHRPRDIERDDDVDAEGRDVFQTLARLRTRQRHDQQHEHESPQPGQAALEAHPRADRQPNTDRRAGQGEPGVGQSSSSAHPPRRGQSRRQQQQHPG